MPKSPRIISSLVLAKICWPMLIFKSSQTEVSSQIPIIERPGKYFKCVPGISATNVNKPYLLAKAKLLNILKLCWGSFESLVS